MGRPMSAHVEVMDLVAQMKSAEQPFVLATVVRTVSVTAAKAGAKAIIRPDGTIVAGWIGGGCARGAVLKAAREALLDGEPRMVSVQPENLLAELGVKPGDNREGIRFASNMCPSKGTMDIFVEPVLPHPSLVIFGASPVAMSLATQARQLGYHVTLAAPAADIAAEPDAHVIVDGFAPRYLNEARRFVVVSTQGKGDEAALRAALNDMTHAGTTRSQARRHGLQAQAGRGHPLHAGQGQLRRRSETAGHAARRFRQIAACARARQEDRRHRGAESAGRARGDHRRDAEDRQPRLDADARRRRADGAGRRQGAVPEPGSRLRGRDRSLRGRRRHQQGRGRI